MDQEIVATDTNADEAAVSPAGVVNVTLPAISEERAKELSEIVHQQGLAEPALVVGKVTAVHPNGFEATLEPVTRANTTPGHSFTFPLPVKSDDDEEVEEAPFHPDADGISIPMHFVLDRQERHENIVEAIRETNDAMSMVRTETRDRDRWLYKVMTEGETAEDVAKFFGLEGKPTRTGKGATGLPMAAVWNRKGQPKGEPEWT